MNTRALRFNQIRDSSETDNFVVFNYNKKYIGDGSNDDDRLSLGSGNSRFVFNTNEADINVTDHCSTDVTPRFEID